MRQSLNADKFSPIPPAAQTSARLDPEAARQLERVDKIEAALAKLPKPKFRPDMLKARTNRTLALMGEMHADSSGPPVGVKKLAAEIDEMKKETKAILDAKVANLDHSVIPVFC